MKDQHRLARLLVDLAHVPHVETSQLQHAFALFKQLTRRERRRLFKMYEQLVGRATIWRQYVKRLVLDDASFDAFSDDFANPPAPNAALIALFRNKPV
jgi:hypothetical protein